MTHNTNIRCHDKQFSRIGDLSYGNCAVQHTIQLTNSYASKQTERSEVLLTSDSGHPNSIPKGKGKAIPLWAWTGIEDSRRLRLPDFKTIGT
jgi:hypothetical protein